jgi:hypothetical protein
VEQAQDVVGRNGAEYVVGCAAEADFALYRTADPANFANAMASGQVPAWLEAVSGFTQGPLKVYRVRR